MELQEYIMCFQVLVCLYCKAMRMKYLKYHSIPKVTKLSQLVRTKPAEFGQWILEMNCKYSRDMKMKYSLVPSIMREIL